MITKDTATVYTTEIDGQFYRLIFIGHVYELLQEQIEYEEGGDAESGPRLYTYTKGYTLLAEGCGSCADNEAEIDQFIRDEIEYQGITP